MGRLSLVDGGAAIFECSTLEPTTAGFTLGTPSAEIREMKKKAKGYVAIPSGTYDAITNYPSAKFHRNMILLLGVPGYSGVLIHAGNTVDDTRGCILVGDYCKVGVLKNSQSVLARLWAAIGGDTKIKVIITEG